MITHKKRALRCVSCKFHLDVLFAPFTEVLHTLPNKAHDDGNNKPELFCSSIIIQMYMCMLHVLLLHIQHT